jgi:hypothetical protein
MGIFESMAGTLGASLMGGLFGNPLILVGFIYLIAIGIALVTKMGFDGWVVTLTLTSIFCGSWFLGSYIGQTAFMGLVGIILGILVSLAVLRWLRH